MQDQKLIFATSIVSQLHLSLVSEHSNCKSNTTFTANVELETLYNKIKQYPIVYIYVVRRRSYNIIVLKEIIIWLWVPKEKNRCSIVGDVFYQLNKSGCTTSIKFSNGECNTDRLLSGDDPEFSDINILILILDKANRNLIYFIFIFYTPDWLRFLISNCLIWLIWYTKYIQKL